MGRSNLLPHQRRQFRLLPHQRHPKYTEKNERKCDDDHMKAASNINIYLMISYTQKIYISLNVGAALSSIHNLAGREAISLLFT